MAIRYRKTDWGKESSSSESESSSEDFEDQTN